MGASFLSLFIIFSENVNAFQEIGDYGVDITMALDSFDAKEVRAAEYKISDSGRFNQNYDTIRIDDLYNGGYDLDSLYSDGYRTLICEMELEMKEVDKGYQHIFIYDDDTSNTYLTGCKYSLGGSDKISSYQTVTFYFELNLSNITDNDFVIRYGASGSFDDDWKNQNLSVYIGLSKEVQKTANMWSLEWIDSTHYSYEELTLSK